MPGTKNVAILMNLSRPYDRQVIHGIARYVQTCASWRLYVEESPADRIPSFTAWPGDGLIVDTDDAQLAEAIPRFGGATNALLTRPARPPFVVPERLVWTMTAYLISVILVLACSAMAGEKENTAKTVMVIPQYQYRNIGDVAHPFGVIRLLQRHIPEVRIGMTWERPSRGELAGMFARHLPTIEWGYGQRAIFGNADLLMTSSAPHWIGLDLMNKWVGQTGGKPFGTYGITGHTVGENRVGC